MKNWNTYNVEKVKGKYLFKFLSEKNLERFLLSGDIWFSRADAFGDKMECVTINDLKSDKPNLKAIEKRKKKFLISCWHEATKETLAFWDSYAETSDKRKIVAIRFKREKLINLIGSNLFKNVLPVSSSGLIHGKVKYRNLLGVKPSSLNNQKVKYSVFRKESVFKYEREYRFVIQLTSDFEKDGYGYNIGNWQSIPFSILVNPLLKKDEYIVQINKIKQGIYGKKFKESTLTKWLKPELW